MTDQPSAASPRVKRPTWLATCLILAIVALLLQLLPYGFDFWRETPRAGRQTPGRTHVSDERNARIEVQYFVYLPPLYDPATRWPLLLYLHGGGQRGDELSRLLEGGGATARLAKGDHFPMIVVSPQCRVRRPWQPEQLLTLLDHIESRFSVDVERIYIAGFSMGGSGAWDLASAAPGRFAAIVPVAGHTELAQAQRLAQMPIWAFHGSADQPHLLRDATATMDAIRALGGSPKLTVYENAGHGIEQVTFARDDLFGWLLKQRRPREATRLVPPRSRGKG